MRSCRARKSCSALTSEAVLRETVMSTIEPDSMSGGKRIEGNSIYVAQGCHGLSVLSPSRCNQARLELIPKFLLRLPRRAGWQANLHDKEVGNRLTRRLSGVSNTVTPASTLPTVKETNILMLRVFMYVWQNNKPSVP